MDKGKVTISGLLGGYAEQEFQTAFQAALDNLDDPNTPEKGKRVVVYVVTRFADTEERKRLLDVCGSLTDGTSVESTDDGVSQRVTVKAGVLTAAKETIKNPFTLQPYRSFHEITQVESPFLLRIGKPAGSVQLALHECDGGAWRNAARRLVVDWLKSEVPAVTAIG